jgi:hypothetical protein
MSLGVVPEQVSSIVPASVFGDIEEQIACHATSDLYIVECRVITDVRPVHGTGLVGTLKLPLMNEL